MENCPLQLIPWINFKDLKFSKLSLESVFAETHKLVKNSNLVNMGSKGSCEPIKIENFKCTHYMKTLTMTLIKYLSYRRPT